MGPPRLRNGNGPLLKMGLVVASVVAAVVVLAGLDRLLGLVAARSPQEVGIVFPPGSSARYSTLEFDFEVQINNLGFRDHDTTLEKTHATRIVAFGDSFTYGWGVALEDTWVKEVERRLRADGRDVEVLNLGVPGLSPGQYADMAEQAVPLLEPDLVVVGLLQTDDLRQTDGAKAQGAGQVLRDRSAISSWLETLYPNLLELASQRRTEEISGLNERSESRWRYFNGVWAKQADAQLRSLGAERTAVFRSWPEQLQAAFEEGKLNPALLTLDLVWGTPRPEELDPRSPLIQERIARCATALGRIKAVAEAHGARVVVVSIPALEHTIPSIWSEMGNVEAGLQQRMISTRAPDEAAREACDRAGVDFVEVTQAFRELEGVRTFFYPYDLHFTGAGQRSFGALVAPHLSAL